MTPENIAALFSQGLACHQGGELQQAEFIYLTVILLDPAHFDALHLAGVICAQQNRGRQGHVLIQRALRIQPNSPSGNQNLANILVDQGNRKGALELYKRAIAINPGHIDALFNLTQNLLSLGIHDQALVVATWNHQMLPQHAEIIRLWIKALAEKGFIEKALAACNDAIKIFPVAIDIKKERASLLQKTSEFTRALGEYASILALNPAEGDVYINQSKCFVSVNELTYAERASERAIRINPTMPEAIINLGAVFQKRCQRIEAEVLYRMAIVHDPAHDLGLRHLGLLLSQSQIYDQSIKVLRRAFQVNPDMEFVADRLLSDLAKRCDWSDFEILRNYIQTHPHIGVEPMNYLWVFDDPESIFDITKGYTSKMGQSRHDLMSPTKRPGNRIRVGYFSSDFANHPVAYNLLPLLRHHNRERFEIIGFDFTLQPDEFSPEIVACLDSHHQVRDFSDEAVADLSRHLEIDIAIDLNGHTGNSRSRIFLNQAAPVLINYLGYPGTMGTKIHDFIIADGFVIPEDLSRFFSEEVLRLPSFFMPYEFKPANRPVTLRRADFDLPEEGFVYASFNNLAKLTPEHFSAWMSVLDRTQNTFLWIASSGAEQGRKRILDEASRRGVSSERIIFASRMPDVDSHIARLGLADLMLDTYPYNGHTTACDAIQAGLPILTRCGKTFASRVVSSLLTTLQVPELISTDQESYIKKAVDLAEDPAQIAGIRSKIIAGKTSGLLPDARSYAQNFESLLEHALAQKIG